MAEAAILLAVKKIGVAMGGELAGSLLANEVSLLTQLPSSMSRIESELLVMQAFLGQIDIRTDNNQVFEAWVQGVRKLAYSVEDTMDEYVHLIAQTQGSGLGGYLKKVVKRSRNLVAWHQIAARLKEFETNFVHLSQMKDRWIKTEEGAILGSSLNYASEKQLHLANSSHFIDEDDLVGIDRSKKTLIEWLFDEDPVSSTISVWGMGGLGKTTLVTNVYKSVRKKFECHAWISISQTYEVDDLLRRMIEELHENEKENVEKIPIDVRGLNHRRLVEKIRSSLENKRYMIILDDVWDLTAFNAIRDAINVDDNNGSRIIITTRSAEVASLAHDTRKLELKVLESTEAWDLFCKRAFRKEKVRECPKELKELGEKIVSKCQGLPLAIVSLGSLLSLREKTNSEWEKVYNRLSWELNNNPNLDNVKHVLNLSYKYLPRYLKNCFLHCSMFPEDHVLQRKRLMRLWVAEGFVEERGSSTMEEVAEDYLKELVHRCMLQVARRNEFDRIKHCRMHDIVRELAVSLSKKENFSAVHDDLQMGGEKRRLSVHKFGNELQSSMELPRLRTFMVFVDPSMFLGTSFSSLCSSSAYLTVLDLQGTSIERVPDEIGDLFNLHFLGLRDTKVKVLPKSLGRLGNLQTLDLMKSEIEKLPSTTRKLKKLRHLFAEKVIDPSGKTINRRRGVRAPKGLWNLKDLQTLQAVEANMEFVERLGNLTQLRSVRIRKVRRIHCTHLCASLSRLRYLYYLDLNASDENEILQLGGWVHPPQDLLKLNLKGKLAEGTMELPLFRALGSSLRKLSLGWSGLREDPLRFLSPLTNLVHLALRKAYDGQQLWFRSRWFPNLKELFLLDMPQLSQVEVEDGTMTRLEFLVLDDLPALKDVPRGIEYLTSLHQLYLKDLHPEFIGRFEESDEFRRIPNVYYYRGPKII